VEHDTDPGCRGTVVSGRNVLVLASPDAIREHWGRASFLSGAPRWSARPWQTAAEIRCFRQKLRGRASRLPCSRPRSVCGYMLPRGRLEGGQTRVPGRSGVTRRECSDHRVTVNLSRPSAAKDGSESMCLVRARHHLEASGFCRGPGNSGSDGDIRRSMRFGAGRLPVSCNLARRHNFRETQCLR
jgi:hypothetical protein